MCSEKKQTGACGTDQFERTAKRRMMDALGRMETNKFAMNWMERHHHYAKGKWHK